MSQLTFLMSAGDVSQIVEMNKVVTAERRQFSVAVTQQQFTSETSEQTKTNKRRSINIPMCRIKRGDWNLRLLSCYCCWCWTTSGDEERNENEEHFAQNGGKKPVAFWNLFLISNILFLILSDCVVAWAFLAFLVFIHSCRCLIEIKICQHLHKLRGGCVCCCCHQHATARDQQ